MIKVTRPEQCLQKLNGEVRGGWHRYNGPCNKKAKSEDAIYENKNTRAIEIVTVELIWRAPSGPRLDN